MNYWKNLRAALGGAIIILIVVGIIALLCYVDYTAYRQRFPNAAPWTYFFQGSK